MRELGMRKEQSGGGERRMKLLDAAASDALLLLDDGSSSSASTDSRTSARTNSDAGHEFLGCGVGPSSYAPSLVSSFDGLHSGVPTRTTPTLTPTTLRTIEQTFLEFTNESGSHSREAGFVPPLIEPSQPTPAQTQVAQPQQVIHEAATQQQQQQQQQQQAQSQHSSSPSTTSSTSSTKRNMGGRRPTRTVGMTPEEEERRQIRRERNKMAAARCRKRRMDHTNALLEETEGLEMKKQNLKEEIQQLQHAKDELEFMLEAHRPACRIQQSSSPPDVKPVIQEQNKQQQQHQGSNGGGELQPEEFSDLTCNGKQPEEPTNNSLCNGRLNRPNSLPIATFTEPKPRPSSLQFKSLETPTFMKSISEVAGIPITTPSSGMFNFDSLMEGGTGLTPVSTPLIPSCSSQQRSNGIAANNNHHHHNNNNNHHHHHHSHPLSAVDLSSPDANPPKLVSL